MRSDPCIGFVQIRPIGLWTEESETEAEGQRKGKNGEAIASLRPSLCFFSLALKTVSLLQSSISPLADLAEQLRYWTLDRIFLHSTKSESRVEKNVLSITMNEGITRYDFKLEMRDQVWEKKTKKYSMQQNFSWMEVLVGSSSNPKQQSTLRRRPREGQRW